MPAESAFHHTSVKPFCAAHTYSDLSLHLPGCVCRAGVGEQHPVLRDVVLPVAMFQFPSPFS